jgi:hypothetical protein
MANFQRKLCLLEIPLLIRFLGSVGPQTSSEAFTEAFFGPGKSERISNISEIQTGFNHGYKRNTRDTGIIREKSSTVSRTQGNLLTRLSGYDCHPGLVIFQGKKYL